MSILKIKNCLAVVVLLGASGYSMESSYTARAADEDAFAPSSNYKPMGPSHSLGYQPMRPSLDLRDDCRCDHRRGSASSDSDSDDEGGLFVKIVNENRGISIAAEAKQLELLKLATHSRAYADKANRFVSASQLHIAKALKCQTDAIKAFAEAVSFKVEARVEIDDASRFFRSTTSPRTLARQEMEAAELMRGAAVSELRMASAEVRLAAEEEVVAESLAVDAAAILRTASVHGSDDEACTSGAKKKKHRGHHGKKK